MDIEDEFHTFSYSELEAKFLDYYTKHLDESLSLAEWQKPQFIVSQLDYWKLKPAKPAVINKFKKRFFIGGSQHGQEIGPETIAPVINWVVQTSDPINIVDIHPEFPALSSTFKVEAYFKDSFIHHNVKFDYYRHELVSNSLAAQMLMRLLMEKYPANHQAG